MKILYVIPSYEPAWTYGGTVIATSHLCRALVRQGIELSVYTTDANGTGGYLNVPINEPVDLGGVKVYYFHSDVGTRKPFYSKGLAKKLRETINDYDLVHVAAIWQWIQIDVYKICKSFSKPYIVSTRGSFSPWAWNVSKMKKRLFWYFWGRKTIQNADAVHFTTEEERLKSFATEALFKKKPSFIIPNGMEIEKIKKSEDVRKKLKIPDNKFVLLSLGRIHRVKGIHIILEALRKIDDERFLFLIVGYKEDKEYSRQLIELSEGFGDRVIFHDSVPKDKVWDFYNSANLFVLPSYSENFGMVVAEAMAYGLPVLISKNVGIWREVQSDSAGFVVDQDAGEIADIIKKLPENEALLNNMSQNSRKSAINRYDINNVASLMLKAYEDVLNNRRSPELQWKL